MKFTEHFKLLLPDLSDPISLSQLNQNTTTLDILLHAFSESLRVSGEAIVASISSLRSETSNALGKLAEDTSGELKHRIRMANGSYEGNGELNRSIHIPDFTPQLVLMWSDDKGPGISRGSPHTGFAIASVSDGDLWARGWQIWRGDELPAAYIDRYGSRKDGSIQFTYLNGYLSWKFASTGAEYDTYGMNACVLNNASSVLYEWIAFGQAESNLQSGITAEVEEVPDE